jgi:hypothetical protein
VVRGSCGSQVGAFERKPAKIAEILAAWLGPEKAEFEAMAVRAKAIGEKWQDALFRIVRDLAAMVKEDPTPNSDARNTSLQLGAA